MRFFFILITLFALQAGKAQFNDSVPPQHWIIDPDSFFTQAQNEATTKLIKDLYTQDSSGIFLLLLDTIPDNIVTFTKKYFKQWNLNNAGHGRTVMFVYTYRDHGLRLEASDEALGILGKQYLKDILTYTVVPRMRKRQDYQGIYKAIDLISKKLINN